ncbi:MAG: PucR family transcriptional regulator [Acidimicrobiia bacterium]|nr:PucR family transcriptional regulator [Acidimicrobiia bacterium]MYC45459.1 PucR family transcriptional regulator [Acidimicrobiia bacterium]
MVSPPAATVRQVLASGALREAVLIGGKRGLDAAVSDIVLRSRVDARTPPDRGAAVVLDAARIGDNLYQVDVALRVISGAGAVALIVVNPDPEIDMGAQRLANRLGVPLAVVTGADVIALTYRLRAEFWAPDVEHVAEVHRLLASLRQMRVADPEAFVELLSAAAHTPVCLIGQDRRPVAGAGIEIGERRLAGAEDYLVDHSARAALHSASIVLAPGEHVSYWLVAESLRSGSSQRLLRSLLQVGSWYLAALLGSGRVRAERDARRRIAVLNEIMHAGEVPERDVQSQLVELGWSASGWNTGLHIKLRGPADPGRIVDLHAEMSDRLAAAGIEGPLVERNDGWSGWMTDAAEPPPESYSLVLENLDVALAGFSAAHSGLQAHGGIGRPYPDLTGLRRSLIEAAEAAVIANARTHEPSGVAHIDRLGVQRVLLGWFSSDDFTSYAGSVLEPVLEMDTEGDLLETLEAYLDASCSTTGAAHRLGVHRNTVSNRVRRVADVLGIRLDDPEVRLSLQLACRVLRINR